MSLTVSVYVANAVCNGVCMRAKMDDRLARTVGCGASTVCVCACLCVSQVKQIDEAKFERRATEASLLHSQAEEYKRRVTDAEGFTEDVGTKRKEEHARIGQLEAENDKLSARVGSVVFHVLVPLHVRCVNRKA